MLLAFSAGSIVCVGPKDVPSMRVAFDSLYDTLHMHTDTEENRAILARYRGDAVTKPRGRKRRRDEFEEDEEDSLEKATKKLLAMTSQERIEGVEELN
jgi:hypothetical protein